MPKKVFIRSGQITDCDVIAGPTFNQFTMDWVHLADDQLMAMSEICPMTPDTMGTFASD